MYASQHPYITNAAFLWLWQRLNFTVDSAYKPRHIKTLVRLSRSSGLYPECLVLNGVNIEVHSIASGSFGDIHKGSIGQHTIAVKILKLCSKIDRDSFLKAIWTFLFRNFNWRKYAAICVWSCRVAAIIPCKRAAVLWRLSARSTKTLLGMSVDGPWRFGRLFGLYSW